MNLISCEGCGVVLDANSLRFAKDISDGDYGINFAVAKWCPVRRDYFAKIKCPVCQHEILQP
jgi:ribosomal protein S27E